MNTCFSSPQDHSTILAELHGAHPRMMKVKALAHHLVWWPNLDQEIEEVVKHCAEKSKSISSSTSCMAVAYPSMD